MQKRPAPPTSAPTDYVGAAGSLYYKRTGSLAEVAEPLGDSKRVAADHYVDALTDFREVDRTVALARKSDRIARCEHVACTVGQLCY